ncbi:MAG: putative inorganic polyphosphate/ATP-NAD kinase [Methanosaeta sp. PtaU1.Bin060]|nr:MAG: putative inorganic polyphosphate/ATP-NAD kinase [Methanosaeta sp. PtaU1.Bin060]
MVAIKIGFVSRSEPESVLLAKRLVNQLLPKAEIFVDQDVSGQIGIAGTPVEEMERQKVDFIVSVGGDGTILRTIHKMNDPVPILGINMGTLGFLVDVEPKDAAGTLERLLSGFDVDERSRLEVLLNERCLPPATNEVVLMTASPAKMIEFEIIVDGALMEDFRADGVIIATSTGSTAYAMSAGGPIVDPRVDAIVLVPMAPFKLSSRPWVIPGESRIEVKLKLPGKEALVVVDGQSTTTISQNDSVVIRKAETPARFVKVGRDGFYEKVKSKLT